MSPSKRPSPRRQQSPVASSRSLGGIISDFETSDGDFSVTVAISPDDSMRILSAGREFGGYVGRVGTKTLAGVLRRAAGRCSDSLVLKFLGNDHAEEEYWNGDVALLFFLDADKSIKLLVAFDLLSRRGDGADHEREGEEEKDEEEEDTSHLDPSSVSALDLNEELAERLMKENATTSKLIDGTAATQLFYSILRGISICVHSKIDVTEEQGDTRVEDDRGTEEHGECLEKPGDTIHNDAFSKDINRAATPTAHNKSPAVLTGVLDDKDAGHENDDEVAVGDWKGSAKTQKEIVEIATFAAQNLMEFATKDDVQSSQEDVAPADTVGLESHDIDNPTKDPKHNPMVSFETFGKWYNAGGFSLVPWLELFDLSKWDNHHADLGTSSKRSRRQHHFNSERTPPDEMIGSPSSLFAAGATVGVTPGDAPTWTGVQSFSSMFGERDDSRTVVSFDFACNEKDETSFRIDITEENLLMLRNLVHRTGLASLSPHQVEEVMMRHSRLERRRGGETVYIISRPQYNTFIRGIVPREASNRFDPDEIENFSNYLTNFFTCFDHSWSDLKKDEVNARELMVGLSFLCAGNKSTKLAAAYEMLDVERNGYLTQRGLMQYLRSYLTMLAGISLLSSSRKNTHQIRKKLMSQKRHDAFFALENGAKWTLSHFMKAFETNLSQLTGSTRLNAVSFEDFAKWYTDGGYKIAPWLELLDLNKFLSLIGESSKTTPKNHSYSSSNSPPEVLFTFPLANKRSLVVLRDDAVYVRTVVAELGLLSLTSEDIWMALSDGVASNTAKGSDPRPVTSDIEVDRATFVQCMIRILTRTPRQRQSAQRMKSEETLKNLFLSFDLLQNNRVALNQLMCGLTLLCGGKKSHKLGFAFGLFGDENMKNGKKKPSLGHQDFFYFFRSFLVVMFSCCNQSLDLNASEVSQYISDTAKLVADDVIGYWRAKHVDRVQFDHFSEWYNEGGFETAPWLELLDLKKWVLADQPHLTQDVPPTPAPAPRTDALRTPATLPLGVENTPASFEPSPNPEAFRALLSSPRQLNGDPSSAADYDPFLDLDMSAVDAEVDEWDCILQHESSSLNYDPTPTGGLSPVKEDPNSLKFHLFSFDHYRGYIISIRPNEVGLLHRIVTETGLFQADASTVCDLILSEAKSDLPSDGTLSNRAFHTAMEKVCLQISNSLSTPASNTTQQEFSTFLDKLFNSFGGPKCDSVNALDIACGITVLCGGRKSDKLEHVFELLDEDKDSLLSPRDIVRFIQSFLVVLMSTSSSISLLDGGICTNDSSTIARAIETGSEWAATQVFEALKPNGGKVCFDDFADWYTKGGYQSIPWLELLDLNKWVLGR